MTYICLWNPAPTATETQESELLHKLIPALLAAAPRVMLGVNGIVWADARGMSL